MTGSLRRSGGNWDAPDLLLFDVMGPDKRCSPSSLLAGPDQVSVPSSQVCLPLRGSARTFRFLSTQRRQEGMKRVMIPRWMESKALD